MVLVRKEFLFRRVDLVGREEYDYIVFCRTLLYRVIIFISKKSS